MKKLNEDYEKQMLEKRWRELQFSTKSHEFPCFCEDCAERLILGRQIRELENQKFQERRERLATV